VKDLIPAERIESKIYLIRGQKVMLDRDLAELYGVLTAQLKRQVRRNIERFPKDFMLVLNKKEVDLLVCQFGIPSKSFLGGAMPFAFTEHGILMLSSVLNSKRAIQVNIQIMRMFTKLRRILATHEELRRKIEILEYKYDRQFKVVFDAIKALIKPPESRKNKIGFLKEKE
jgi:phage regulator Rha-like protein